MSVEPVEVAEVEAKADFAEKEDEPGLELGGESNKTELLRGTKAEQLKRIRESSRERLIVLFHVAREGGDGLQGAKQVASHRLELGTLREMRKRAERNGEEGRATFSWKMRCNRLSALDACS